ncbi:MAG TPA: ribbon-helix-helix protein, CopG family [Thermoanaerobaculia bacterium]|jgi:plasmid stability protein|nr:ribbon-helix-helix protein, CopG family [Thermoanaerobaculia bacterium]
MSTTITIRADESLRRELEDRAAAMGKSLSEMVREILRNALAETPLEGRTGHLRGGIDLRRTDAEPWRRELRERNWRR